MRLIGNRWLDRCSHLPTGSPSSAGPGDRLGSGGTLGGRMVTDGVVAIVPMKSLSEVKGRLSSRLSPAERARFALESLDQVLAATAGSAAVSATLVVSPDARVRSR